MRWFLTVLGKSNVAHQINKHLGEVQKTAMLTGSIVIWKCVMVVMEAFPWNENKYEGMDNINTLLNAPNVFLC